MRPTTFTIRSISSEETYPIRHPVLRKGRPVETCRFDGDDLENTIHLGLYLNHALVGVATFLNQCNALFSEECQYQLRGMAVLEDFQGQTFGKALMAYGEDQLKKKKAQRIWFNARIVAVDFYQKLGYQTVGELFEIPGVGKHFIMTKRL